MRETILVFSKERFRARDKVQQSKKLLSAAKAHSDGTLNKAVKQGRAQHKRSNRRA